jgi:hypothetical protein
MGKKKAQLYTDDLQNDGVRKQTKLEASEHLIHMREHQHCFIGSRSHVDEYQPVVQYLELY